MKGGITTGQTFHSFVYCCADIAVWLSAICVETNYKLMIQYAQAVVSTVLND